MSYKVLAINPGSTSTKIAVYTDDEPTFTQSISHSAEDLARFSQVVDQFDWRKELIEKALADNGIKLSDLSAVIGRGGLINPVESGVYEVNDALIHDLRNARMQHASNLGGLIARDIADEIGVKAYIADPVVVDEMMPYARISGMPELPRTSVFHALNQKAVARLYARESDRKYEDLNLIVCHMGGGCTVSAHRRGRVIDTTNALDGCGPISPERSGSLPPGPLIKLCFSGKYTEAELMRMVHGAGGLMAHLGTTSVPEVLDRILNRDLHAMLVLRGMCYSIAKEIGAMSVALKGDVDAILITGGIAHSKRVTDFIAGHVDFIAPIYVYPGENELKALAENALAVLRGERQARTYVSEEYDDPARLNDTTHTSKLRDALLDSINNSGIARQFSAIRSYFRSGKQPKN
ncbi:MAG: butyrate kinase [Bacteroides sp.]|nr:butyrate kinase [Bacteroidales bacterium]MBD5250341.1 butyrate kinase [Barnesiella sp.]MBD5344773.1 butyrate kinase [Bacteroides sp.]MDE5829736.1 butyrate kinase [Duncaniella sp.]MBD5254267.1 butyrate kinase [Barnesiella sp.]